MHLPQQALDVVRLRKEVFHFVLTTAVLQVGNSGSSSRGARLCERKVLKYRTFEVASLLGAEILQ